MGCLQVGVKIDQQEKTTIIFYFIRDLWDVLLVNLRNAIDLNLGLTILHWSLKNLVENRR